MGGFLHVLLALASLGICEAEVGLPFIGADPRTTEEACTDGNPSCPAWAEKGECTANPHYMDSMCRLSCGRCGEAATTIAEATTTTTTTAGAAPTIAKVATTSAAAATTLAGVAATTAKAVTTSAAAATTTAGVATTTAKAIHLVKGTLMQKAAKGVYELDFDNESRKKVETAFTETRATNASTLFEKRLRDKLARYPRRLAAGAPPPECNNVSTVLGVGGSFWKNPNVTDFLNVMHCAVLVGAVDLKDIGFPLLFQGSTNTAQEKRLLASAPDDNIVVIGVMRAGHVVSSAFTSFVFSPPRILAPLPNGNGRSNTLIYHATQSAYAKGTKFTVIVDGVKGSTRPSEVCPGFGRWRTPPSIGKLHRQEPVDVSRKIKMACYTLPNRYSCNIIMGAECQWNATGRRCVNKEKFDEQDKVCLDIPDTHTCGKSGREILKEMCKDNCVKSPEPHYYQGKPLSWHFFAGLTHNDDTGHCCFDVATHRIKCSRPRKTCSTGRTVESIAKYSKAEITYNCDKCGKTAKNHGNDILKKRCCQACDEIRNGVQNSPWDYSCLGCPNNANCSADPSATCVTKDQIKCNGCEQNPHKYYKYVDCNWEDNVPGKFPFKPTHLSCSSESQKCDTFKSEPESKTTISKCFVTNCSNFADATNCPSTVQLWGKCCTECLKDSCANLDQPRRYCKGCGKHDLETLYKLYKPLSKLYTFSTHLQLCRTTTTTTYLGFTTITTTTNQPPPPPADQVCPPPEDVVVKMDCSKLTTKFMCELMHEHQCKWNENICIAAKAYTRQDQVCLQLKPGGEQILSDMCSTKTQWSKYVWKTHYSETGNCCFNSADSSIVCSRPPKHCTEGNCIHKKIPYINAKVKYDCQLCGMTDSNIGFDPLRMRCCQECHILKKHPNKVSCLGCPSNVACPLDSHAACVNHEDVTCNGCPEDSKPDYDEYNHAAVGCTWSAEDSRLQCNAEHNKCATKTRDVTNHTAQTTCMVTSCDLYATSSPTASCRDHQLWAKCCEKCLEDACTSHPNTPERYCKGCSRRDFKTLEDSYKTKEPANRLQKCAQQVEGEETAPSSLYTPYDAERQAHGRAGSTADNSIAMKVGLFVIGLVALVCSCCVVASVLSRRSRGILKSYVPMKTEPFMTPNQPTFVASDVEEFAGE